MLPEYGIVMSLVRSTSAALLLCDLRHTTCEPDISETTVLGDDGDTACDGKTVMTRKQLSINDVVDILCYVWYLPLFLAGPLMTCGNFRRQVGTFSFTSVSLLNIDRCSKFLHCYSEQLICN